MRIPIILVSPARADNIGAAARAMKTMGFSELRIVASEAHLQPAARYVAHGASDIIDNIQTFSTLHSALQDVDFSVATTARSRAKFRYYATPEELTGIMREKAQWMGCMALVFGCEEYGLTNEELAQVDMLSGVTMAADYPSLNLGQAVMVYCYQLSALMAAPLAVFPAAGGQGQLHALRGRCEQLLARMNVSDDRKLAEWLSQRLGTLEQRDVAMLHRLLQDIEKFIP